MAVRNEVGQGRDALGGARRVVVKIGSKLLAESPAARPAAIADEVVRLRAERELEVVVVSSGAIALGMRAIGLSERPTDMPSLQAVAAVGQRALLQYWEQAFAAHGVLIGQVLVTHDDLGDRTRFLNARNTLRALLNMVIVPIINENDTVASEEITFGDNDMLAALTCNLVSADALILLTDVDGLRDAGDARIPIVRNIDHEAAPVATGAATGTVGSGGMASKVQAARIANRSGIPIVVASGRAPGVLTRLLQGENVGTLFVPSVTRIGSRKHWLAYGSKPTGQIVVDDGARDALTARGSSLLPIGVVGVAGDFAVGEIVSVVDRSGHEVARGLTAYSGAELRKIQGTRSGEIAEVLGYKYVDEVIHRDDLVTL